MHKAAFGGLSMLCMIGLGSDIMGQFITGFPHPDDFYFENSVTSKWSHGPVNGYTYPRPVSDHPTLYFRKRCIHPHYTSHRFKG